jgi:hypothetical protein
MGLSIALLPLVEQALDLTERARALMGADHPGTDGYEGLADLLADAQGALELAYEQLHRLSGRCDIRLATTFPGPAVPGAARTLH